MQPLYEFGGHGATLHMAVANGFPPVTYAPLVRPFLNAYRVVCLPPRGLWPGEKPPEKLHQWDVIAEDLLNGFREHGLKDVIAVGHSFGGVASLIAASRAPEYFRALVLLDPTIFLPEWAVGMAQAQADGSIRELPLVQGAMRRRRVFENADAVYANFRSKKAFSDWPDETVRLYAEGGTRPTADGQGVELLWPPEWEAYYYMTAYTDTLNLLPNLRGKLPILMIRGGNSDTLLPEVGAMMRAALPEMAYAEIVGHGHLFPQSAPGETVGVIQEWLGDKLKESSE